ncbi:S8 family peptidase [Lacrimispora sp. JR3]|uniref:S8 family peptidase n=1 Tax=Lacrimispora sinapis TaxID=3111456 RepID=UPI0037487548
MQKILDNEYYDFIINNALVPDFNNNQNVTKLNEKHSLLHIHKSKMDACDLGLHSYDSFPSLFTLSSKVSVEKSGIGSVQRQPHLNLLGLGVIIGIIDTGINYQHPAFRNQDGSTRILSIWDQTDQSGLPPSGFDFGSEYGKNHINSALKSSAPWKIVPTNDTNGHGTAIASIASGTPNEEESFTGVAPQTKLAVVKLKEAKKNLKNIFLVPEDALCYQESDIILGIRFLISVSERLNRPLVICIALGSSQGGHSGRGALSSYIDHIVSLPKIDVSIAAGNEGNKGRHYFHHVSSPPFQHGFYMNIGNADKSFSMEIWPFPPGRVLLDIASPDGEFIQEESPSAKACQNYQLFYGETRIWVNNINMEGESGDQLILVRFENPIPGPWFFMLHNIENEPFSIRSWLPSGNLLSRETYFYESTSSTTITAPGNARNPLTVAAYDQFNDQILAESGRGYTSFGQIVPDIAAPGFRIPCAMGENEYGIITGTGAAAAHAAGAAAMVMEWGFCRGNLTNVTGLLVNRMIVRGARRSSTDTYPNNTWGYGQLDIYHLFKRISVI